ncbi:MAG: HEAT repeat domain-containing protein [Planctomycetes bacterium]|nr:HEAT repeat domain-containing protein [Planctomycetota bacterium]
MNPSQKTSKSKVAVAAPYIGLRPFKEHEADRFFGRNNEIRILLNKIRTNRLTLLLAGSGVGKSSLLKAGIMPILRTDNRSELIYYRDWELDPQEFKQKLYYHYSLPYHEDVPLKKLLQVCTLFSNRRLILILDQFEELFNYHRFKPELHNFIENELSPAILDRSSPVSFVFSMREDFALELNAFKDFLPGVFDNYFRLEKLDREQARLAMEEPLKKVGYSFEGTKDGQGGLLDQIIDDLAKREQERQFGGQDGKLLKDLLVEPPHLQIVCQELWEKHRDEGSKQITWAAYKQARRAQGILETYFLVKINKFSRKEQALASAAFDHLIGQRATKIAHPFERLVELTGADENLLKRKMKPVLKLMLRAMRKVREIWKLHFHDEMTGLFSKDEQEDDFDRFMSRLIARIFRSVKDNITYFLKKHAEFDVDLLKVVLDELQDRAVLRRQKRGEEFWYELYHDIFAESIDAWNRDFKHRRRVKRLVSGTVAALLVGGLIFAGSNFLINHRGRYLQLSSQTGISDRVEMYRGREKGWDLFGLGGFDYETPFLRQELEADKRFYHSVVEDKGNTRANLVGRLPLLERLPRYAKNGLYGKVDELAGNILGSKEEDLISSLPAQLSNVRAAKSSALLSDEGLTKKEVVAALGKLGESFGLVKFLADKDAEVRRDAAKTLGRLGDGSGLVKLLAGKDLEVRRDATEALVRLGDSSVTPELVKLLKHKDAEVRRDAAKVLVNLDDSSVTPELAELLADKDAEVRLTAAEALVNLDDSSVIPELVKLLVDKDEDVRMSTAYVLGNLGDSSIIPELVKLLADKDADVRVSAAYALGNLGDSLVIPELVKLLVDKDAEVRRAAAEALGRLGDSSGFVKLLADKDAEVRRSAANALGRLGDSSVTPELVNLLKDKSAFVRRAAAYVLGNLGDSSITPELVKLLVDKDAEVRRAAAEALGRLGDISVTPELVKLLKDKNAGMRRYAAKALGRLGDSSVTPELVKLLADENDDVRRSAAEALGRLGDSSVTPELVKLLKDKSAFVRGEAAEVLGKLGDSSVMPELVKLLKGVEYNFYVSRSIKKALENLIDSLVTPELVKLLADEKWEVWEVRQYAAEALVNLDDSSVIPELVKLLVNKDEDVRGNVAEVLGNLGDSSVIPELVKLLADKDEDVRGNVAEALGNLGDSSVIPELVKLLADKDEDVRGNVAEALGNLGDSSVTPELVKFLADKDLGVRRNAAEALGNLGDNSVISELVKLLANQDAGVRVSAAYVLGNLGDSSVTFELVKLLADKDEDVRRNVAEALGNLGDSSVTPELVKLLADKSALVRGAAAEALGNLGDSSVTPELIKLLVNEGMSVRGDAAEALGALGSKSAIPELLRLFHDQHDTKGTEALFSLGQLQAIEAESKIIKLKFIEGGFVSGEAALALARINSSAPELKMWRQRAFTEVQEKNEKNAGARIQAARRLTYIAIAQSAALLVQLIDDQDLDVAQEAVRLTGRLAEFHPEWIKPEPLLALLNHADFNLRQAAIKALGQLISFQGEKKPADLLNVEQKVRAALHKMVADEQKNFIDRQAALVALGATKRQDCAEEIYELLTNLEKGKDDALRYRSFLWLGQMVYTDAQDDVEAELKELMQEKAAWRKERDTQKREDASVEIKGDQEDKSWRKEHWEYMLGNALARIAPGERGIELLDHPLYQVRQGAIRALASKVADEDKAGVGAALIGKIIQAHQNFDPEDLPSPFPYAAFQAIDLALWNLEYTGKKDDLDKLKDILENLEKCKIPGQQGAIKERLQWTIDRLKSRLKQNDSNENQSDLSRPSTP